MKRTLFKRIKAALFPGTYKLKAIDKALFNITKALNENFGSVNLNTSTLKHEKIDNVKLNAFTLNKLNKNYCHFLDNLKIDNSQTDSFFLYKLIENCNFYSHCANLENPVIVTVAIGSEYQTIVHPGLEKLKRYCQLHSYSIFILNDARRFDRELNWIKLAALDYVMNQGFRHVMWLDADTVITNPDIVIEPFFKRLEEGGKSILIGLEVNYFNCGVCFLLNNGIIRNLLHLIWENGSFTEFYLYEQDSLVDLCNRYSEVQSLIDMENNLRLFNSFPPDYFPLHLHSGQKNIPWPNRMLWQPNDFIIHLAGLARPQLKKAILEYANLP